MSDPFLSTLLSLFSKRISFPLKDLKSAREQLWLRYQRHGEAGFHSQEERVAYILARLPATYTACQHVLRHLSMGPQITRIVDLGCGPGTATLACLSLGVGQSFTLVEGDKEMLNLCKDMVTPYTAHTTYHHESLLREAPYPEGDIVMLSYVLSEMSTDKQRKVLEKAFKAAQKYLVIISPGTSALFQEYLFWRRFLVEQGGVIIAPCPKSVACPLEASERWCHFKARVQRTKELKNLKNASMSFEDEPYSYLIVAKPNTIHEKTVAYRIIDRPQHRKGHSHFFVCTGEKIETFTLCKKDPRYKALKKRDWGDGWG